MKLGRLGVWYSTDKLNGSQLADLMQVVEKNGYSAFWHPESRGYEAMSLGSYLLSKSEKLVIGSSIANIAPALQTRVLDQVRAPRLVGLRARSHADQPVGVLEHEDRVSMDPLRPRCRYVRWTESSRQRLLHLLQVLSRMTERSCVKPLAIADDDLRFRP